jgi:FAD/FMN-containing dehydrogenase
VAPSGGTPSIDGSLHRRFAGELYAPGDPGFEDAARPWNATVSATPALVARCSGTDDVVLALGYARRHGLEVAVRSGGHSVSGTSTVHGGVLIDLGAMDAVEVDPDRRRVRVQGGALLGAMDRATLPHGLATTAGMVSHTGVGGLTLGGGYGYLARRHGLACDNLISAEVVTSAGDVVTASEEREPDLLWGLRGGGGNFGIVTSFEFDLHPVRPDVISGELLFRGDDGPAVLRAFRDLAGTAPREVVSVASATVARSSWGIVDERWVGRPVVDIEYTVLDAELDEGERLADGLRRAASPIWQETKPIPYLELQTLGDASWAAGRRRAWKSSLLWELTDEMLDTFVARADAVVGTGAGVELVSLGGRIADVGEDETAYSNRDAAFDFLAVAQWDDAAADEEHLELTRENWRAIAAFSPGGVYVNNLGADADDRVREAYGAAKYERLVELKDRWDPDNVFHRNANIRPSGRATG